MPQFRIHILLNQLNGPQLRSFLWRLLLPLAFLLALPHAERFLQELFLAEGLIRILFNTCAFRGPVLLAFRTTGVGVLGFLLEEGLQELLLMLLNCNLFIY